MAVAESSPHFLRTWTWTWTIYTIIDPHVAEAQWPGVGGGACGCACFCLCCDLACRGRPLHRRFGHRTRFHFLYLPIWDENSHSPCVTVTAGPRTMKNGHYRGYIKLAGDLPWYGPTSVTLWRARVPVCARESARACGLWSIWETPVGNQFS